MQPEYLNILTGLFNSLPRVGLFTAINMYIIGNDRLHQDNK
jgi:hypothetical protein